MSSCTDHFGRKVRRESKGAVVGRVEYATFGNCRKNKQKQANVGGVMGGHGERRNMKAKVRWGKQEKVGRSWSEYANQRV